MKPQTSATLENLRKIKWFCNVGARDTSAAIVVSSWESAIKSCSSPDWENLCLEAANQYRERLKEQSISDANRWNEIVDLVKKDTQPLVIEKTQDVIEEFHLPKIFLDTVSWDILHLCMESEFSDIYQPGFYASQAYWYSMGHFPCGWEGNFPHDGKLIIY